MTSPYTTPPAPRPADARPLYKRKRVWAGAVLLLGIGSAIGSSGDKTEPVAAKPAVHVTATATVTTTVTETPAPKVTVTKTAKPKPAPTVTVTETETADSGYSYDDSSGGTSGGDSTYYSNCSEARAAGAAPLYSGDPGYDSHLDRDGDGVACE
jgi:hypothetical protein